MSKMLYFKTINRQLLNNLSIHYFQVYAFITFVLYFVIKQHEIGIFDKLIYNRCYSKNGAKIVFADYSYIYKKRQKTKEYFKGCKV